MEKLRGQCSIGLAAFSLCWLALVPVVGAAGARAELKDERGSRVGPFESAGDHFNPAGKQHGRDNPRGPHAGDLPNVPAAPSRHATIEIVVPHVLLAALLDADGASLVVHESADDYKTDPGGNAGRRIACGVITRS